MLCPLPQAQARDFSAVISVSSNYYYRGYSKSAGGPTVRGNMDYQPAGWFYLGSWISRVDFGDREFANHSNVEFYPYLGLNFNLSDDWRLEASAARYLYDGKLFGKNSDYNEYSIAVHFRDLATVRVDFAPDLYNRGGGARNYEISGRYPILEKLVVSAGLGYNDASAVLEYDAWYWNAGITWFFTYGALDLRYVDQSETSPSSNPNAIDLPDLGNRFVFSLTAGF